MELSLTTFILLLFSFVAVLLRLLIRKKTKQLTYHCVLPGPFSLPIIGHSFSVDLQNLHLTFFDYAERYGKVFQVKIFGQNIVVINDSLLARKAFSGDEYGDVFNERPPSFVGKYIGFESKNISFGSCNRRTQTLRKMLHKGLKVFGEGLTRYEQHVSDELTRLILELKAKTEEEFDFEQLLRDSFGNWMSSLLTGKQSEPEDSNIIWNLLDSVNSIMSPDMTFILNTFPFLRNVPGRPGNLFKSAIDARNKCLRKFVLETRKTPDNKNDEDGLVEMLFKMHEDENKKAGYMLLDDLYLLGLIQDIIFAGTETTTTALINAFALILQYPDCGKKIQIEIDNVVGQSRGPQLDDRKSMPYTKAFILEVLRFTSQAPLGVPHRANNDQIFEGCSIKKDSILFLNIWFIHHDSKIWKDPWNFRPDRFLDTKGELLSPEHELMQSLVTFSFGRRACPGETLAMTRMFIYVTRILQVFDVCLPASGVIPNTDPRFYRPGLNLRVQEYFCKAVLR